MALGPRPCCAATASRCLSGPAANVVVERPWPAPQLHQLCRYREDGGRATPTVDRILEIFNSLVCLTLSPDAIRGDRHPDAGTGRSHLTDER